MIVYYGPSKRASPELRAHPREASPGFHLPNAATVSYIPSGKTDDIGSFIVIYIYIYISLSLSLYLYLYLYIHMYI